MRSCGFSSKCKASAQISLEGSRTRSAPSVSRSAAWNSRLRCVDFSARVAGAASFDALVSAFQIFWSMLVRNPSPGVSASKSVITSSINACHRPIGESLQPPQAYSNSYHPSRLDRTAAPCFRGEIPRAWLVASSALSPVQIGAHSGPQLRDLVDRVGAYRERSQVKVSGGADGLPACIFALRRDLLDLYEDAPIAERWNANAEAIADLERPGQIFAQIEVDPHVVQIDQCHQCHARRNVFTRLYVAFVDLESHRRVDHHLVDDRLHGLDVGNGFADIRLGDLVLFSGVTIDRVIVGRLGLIDGTLVLMQRIGGLVEPRDRGIAVLGQLADAVVGLLRQHNTRLCSLELRFARGNHLWPGADIDIGKLRLGNDPRGQGSFLAIVSGLSMRTSTAPAATSCPGTTGMSATRPSTRAAMSRRVASISPCTSRGCGRTRYQIDKTATAATTTPTMIEGSRVGEDGHFFNSALGLPVSP